MAIYARIQAGIVAELFTPPSGTPIAACFHSALTWIDVTTVSPAPQPGWTATETGGVWSFAAAPAPSAPTLAQQAAALLAGGLAVTFATTTAFSATYPTDAVSIQKMLGVQMTLTATGHFPGGATTWPLKTAATPPVWNTMTAAQYTAVAAAIAAFVAGCDLVIDGQSTTLPAATATVND